MANSQINWRKGDYISLGKAVSQFNRKINELQKEETRNYLPDVLNYADIKENITTRRELQRVIKSLRRFKEEGAEDLYRTQAGEEITKWERHELGIESRTAQIRLTKELENLYTPKQGEKYSRAQMGSIRVREIEAQLRNLKQIESKKGYQFERLRQRIHNIGTSDYNMRRAITYRNNYINEMKKYSHLKNYELLKEKMESLSNPVDFYEFVKDKELVKDLTYQSDEYYKQAEFNEFLRDWEIEVEETEEVYEETVKVRKYNYSLMDKDGTVVAESNSLRTLRNIAEQYKGTTWIRDNSYL